MCAGAEEEGARLEGTGRLTELRGRLWGGSEPRSAGSSVLTRGCSRARGGSLDSSSFPSIHHLPPPPPRRVIHIRPHVSLAARTSSPSRSAMSNDTQRADQIAHRLYSKLALVVNHARATIEPPPNAKVDKWVSVVLPAL